MLLPDRLLPGKVRNRACDPLYALVGAGRQRQLLGRAIEQRPALLLGSKRRLEMTAAQFHIAQARTLELN